MIHSRTEVPSGIGPKIIVLAPSPTAVIAHFHRVSTDTARYHEFLAGMQRLRGAVYHADGAIEAHQLLPDGRHVVPADSRSWHLLALGPDNQVCACARYQQHALPVPFQDLGVGRSALAQSDVWGQKLQAAIYRKISVAQEMGRNFAEVGGWAVCQSMRYTTAALRVALATFALARALGGCIGVTTATARNCSSRILRRIGGSELEHQGDAIPPYYDPLYKCQMEILRFDSSTPNPKFLSWIETLFFQLSDTPVFCPGLSDERAPSDRFANGPAARPFGLPSPATATVNVP